MIRAAGRTRLPPGRAAVSVPPPYLACGLLAALLMFVPLSVAAAAQVDDEVKRLEEVRREIERMRGDLSGVRDRHARQREELRATEVAIGEISRALARLADRQREKDAELRRLEARRAEATAALEAQRAALGEQILATYVMGRQGRMKVILSQEDPAALGRMLAYYDYFNRARAQRIAGIRDGLRELDALEVAIAEEGEAIARLREERAGRMAELDASRAERRQVLARLEADIESREQRLAALRQDERNLSELVERLRAAIREAPPVDLPDGVPFASLKGKLPWPVRGKLAARFGSNRQVERLRWQGVLIDADEGSEVRAIYNGRVAFADWLRGFGLLVIVDHGNGYMSLYGHNQSLYKSVGDTVSKGETIATVGSSGGRDRPGLYFEIRHKGTPDDPLKWCRAEPG